MAEGEVKDYSISELWERLVTEDELILTIFSIDEKRVRRGLIKAKAKAKEKLLQAGIEPEEQELQFKLLPNLESGDDDLCRLHCSLLEKERVPVIELIVPNEEI